MNNEWGDLQPCAPSYLPAHTILPSLASFEHPHHNSQHIHILCYIIIQHLFPLESETRDLVVGLEQCLAHSKTFSIC